MTYEDESLDYVLETGAMGLEYSVHVVHDLVLPSASFRYIE